jgi:hypothetical protein
MRVLLPSYGEGRGKRRQEIRRQSKLRTSGRILRRYLRWSKHPGARKSGPSICPAAMMVVNVARADQPAQFRDEDSGSRLKTIGTRSTLVFWTRY